MSEVTVGARVRSLRDTIPGLDRGGYLGRVGTVADIDGRVLVRWDDDDHKFWWFPKDLELVEGGEG